MTSQTQQIHDYLKSGKPLTAIEALELFKCFRLASRISDLKRQGYTINSELITTSTGKRVAQYSLPTSEITPFCKTVPQPIKRTAEYGC